MKTFVCQVCGHLVFDEVPEVCPSCGAPREKFAPAPETIKKPSDPANLNDLEKKHIPVISVNKACALAGGGCTDVTVKTGETLHVMEEKHHIVYMDFYHERKFIARYHMTPKLNPVVAVHLKINGGKFTVIEFCNIHGRWMSEAEL